jgi:surface protein
MGIIAASRLRATGISPFIIEVDTSNAGSANDAFQFTGAVGDYDVVAKQGGSVVQTFTNLSDEETITFSDGSGVYVLEVTPKATNGFNRISFNNGGDRFKVKDIKQLGTIVWSSFEGAFYGCTNMRTSAIDEPNLSSVTSMKNMFHRCGDANPDTSNWDVSSVTNMDSMFLNATSANPDVSNWNVSSVTTMENMFLKAFLANPDVSNWDVSSVTNMGSMFESAQSANPNTSNWNVSSVTNMDSIFQNASLANPDTSNWNMSSVTNTRNMFRNASLANPDTSNWNVSSVTIMFAMFLDASSANPDTSNWDVSSVGDMRAIFVRSNLSVQNLTACYENWSLLTLRNNVGFSAGTIKYNSTGQSGRDILENTYNWSITDGGQV